MSTGTLQIKRNNNFFVVILGITQLFSLISLMNRNASGERITNYIFFVIGIVLFMLALIQKKNRYDKILPLCFLFLYSAVLWVITGSNFDTIIANINFILMISVWSVVDCFTYSRQLKKYISFITVIQGLALIVTFFSDMAYAPFVSNTIRSDLLTLGFNNPNETGIVIFNTVFVLLILTKSIEKKINRVFIFGEIGFLVYLLFLTGSRTSILATVLLIIWIVFLKRSMFHSRKSRNILSIAVICFPLLFMIVYLSLFDKASITVQQTFLGKSIFSGRQSVYFHTLERWSNIILGNLNEFQFSNSHNAMLTILVNLGIIGFFIYLIYTLRRLLSINKIIPEESTLPTSYIAILCIIVASSGESAILVGGNIYYYYLLIALVILKHDIEEIKLEK